MADEFSSHLGAHYELIEEIGRGASGVVYLATDRRTGERVAAKLLRAEHLEDPDVVTRFVRERTILTSLVGESIVRVRDLVVEGDRLAIIQEYVPGVSLRDVLRSRGPLSPSDVGVIMSRVLSALASAHASHVIHRDVKPDIVLVVEPLFTGPMKLTDFGISSIVSDSQRTSTALVGTPAYMPPELIEFGDATAAGDVYSAGIMAYELLGGRTPFAGTGTDFTVANRHLKAAPPRIPVDDDLWALLARMLAKRPETRPTADQAREAFDALADQLVGQSPLTRQADPDEFPEEYGPATVVRHQALDHPVDKPEIDFAASPSVDMAEFGPRDNATVIHSGYRPERVERPYAATEVEDPDPKKRRNLFIAVGALAGALLIAGASWMMTHSNDAPTVQEEISVERPGMTLPTGLTTTRRAHYDPQSQELTYSVTYEATTAPLTGPFFESVTGGNSCQPISWDSDKHVHNLATETKISDPCGWALDPGRIEPGTPVTVTGVVEWTDGLTEANLTQWVEDNEKATTAALTDPDLISRSYPVQRITGIVAQTPSRIPSGEPVTITIYAKWPSGVDDLNPIYIIPSTGVPSSVFTAIAGSTEQLRLIDNCAGAVAVSSSRTVATALRPAKQCTVLVDLGNFDETATTSFDIVGHGS